MKLWIFCMMFCFCHTHGLCRVDSWVSSWPALLFGTLRLTLKWVKSWNSYVCRHETDDDVLGHANTFTVLACCGLVHIMGMRMVVSRLNLHCRRVMWPFASMVWHVWHYQVCSNYCRAEPSCVCSHSSQTPSCDGCQINEEIEWNCFQGQWSLGLPVYHCATGGPPYW